MDRDAPGACFVTGDRTGVGQGVLDEPDRLPLSLYASLVEAGEPIGAVELGRGHSLLAHPGTCARRLRTRLRGGGPRAAPWAGRGRGWCGGPHAGLPVRTGTPCDGRRTRLLWGTAQGSSPSTKATDPARSAGNSGLDVESDDLGPFGCPEPHQGGVESSFQLARSAGHVLSKTVGRELAHREAF